ncbi:hypothetical protein EUGRSUZ_H04081 [Eucalyptus grandis]|uniref:Uncharacterized protein n=2 Tax=Eucalyptus grandis TaxID=71139 RepID=A0ACC3JWY2_EUCGR|nr:hypothetical protein EUGRSUZ_H04081 [Eucalyptus grandis]
MPDDLCFYAWRCKPHVMLLKLESSRSSTCICFLDHELRLSLISVIVSRKNHGRHVPDSILFALQIHLHQFNILILLYLL